MSSAANGGGRGQPARGRSRGKHAGFGRGDRTQSHERELRRRRRGGAGWPKRDDFDDQRMEKRKLTLEAGDLLRVTCDYMNTADDEVTFGESSNEEMCFFVGFALGDAPVQADCPNLWDALFTL